MTQVVIEHVLYAQAIQIALALSGQKNNLGASFLAPNTVQACLESHRELTNHVYAYLLGQQVKPQ
jgi:hypothetical protein